MENQVGQTNKQWQWKITVPSGFTGRGLIRPTKQNHHSRHNTMLAHHSQYLNKAEFFFITKNLLRILVEQEPWLTVPREIKKTTYQNLLNNSDPLLRYPLAPGDQCASQTPALLSSCSAPLHYAIPQQPWPSVSSVTSSDALC